MIYLDRPVFNWRPHFRDVSQGLLDDHSYETEGHGAATPVKVTTVPRRTLKLTLLFGSRAELGELRQFLHERAGRRRGFWLPCWITDYELTESVAAGATELPLERVTLHDALALDQFKHLFIATARTLELHAIEDVDEGDVVTLAEPVESDLPAGRVVIGGLLFVRLAADEIKCEFQGHNFCRVRLSFTELPAEYEEAHDGEMPIHLYELTRHNSVWRYANWGRAIEAGGEEWDPQNITHTELRFGIEFLGSETMLQCATDDPTHPLRYHADALALGVTNLRVFEVDGDDLPAELPPPIYVGRVGAINFGAEAQMSAECSSAFRVAEINTPRPAITRRCQHQFGDEFCGVNLAAYTTSGTITGLGTAWVEADEFGAKATAEADPDWFVMGVVTVGDEQRFCTGADGDRLYLNAPFRFAAVDDAVSARAGCNKLITTCHAKFNNKGRHVGFFYVPDQNPQFTPARMPQKDTGGKKAG